MRQQQQQSTEVAVKEEEAGRQADPLSLSSSLSERPAFVSLSLHRENLRLQGGSREWTDNSSSSSPRCLKTTRDHSLELLPSVFSSVQRVSSFVVVRAAASTNTSFARHLDHHSAFFLHLLCCVPSTLCLHRWCSSSSRLKLLTSSSR